MQTKVAKGIAAYLSNELNAQVSVGFVEIQFVNKLLLRDFYLEDQNGDSLIFAKELLIEIDDYSLENKTLIINNIVLNDALFSMQKSQGQDRYNLDFLTDYFASTDQEQNSSFGIDVKTIKVVNSEFRINDWNEAIKPYGIDYAHLHLSRINLEISNFSNSQNFLMADIDELSFSERSGFNLASMSTGARYSKKQILLDELQIVTPQSEIVTKLLSFNYDEVGDFKQFVEKVNMSGKFRKSTVGTKDLSYFVPFFEGLEDSLMFSCNLNGKVSHLLAEELQLEFGESSKVNGEILIRGLPELSATYFDVELSEINTTIADIKRLKKPPFTEDEDLDVPSNIETFEFLKGTAEFKGTMNDFMAKADVSSGAGGVRGSFELTYDSIKDNYAYDGVVSMNNFDVGLLAGDNSIGRVTTNLRLNSAANNAFDLSSLSSEVNASFDSFEFMGYTYTNIQVDGKLTKDSFEGSLLVDDEHIALDFNGLVDFSQTLPRYRFTAAIQKAHLYELNLERSDETQIICSTISVDGTGSNADNFNGTIVARDLSYYLQGKDYFFDSIYVVSTLDSASHALSVYSNFIDLSIDGSFRLQELPDAFHTLAGEILPSVFEPSDDLFLIEEDFSFFVDVKDLSFITSLFLKDVQVAPNTQLNGIYETRRQDLSLNINSDWIQYKDYRLNDIHLETDKFSNLYEFALVAKRFDINDTVHMDNLRLVTALFSDNVGARLSWQANDSSNSGDINWDGYWLARDQFQLRLDTSTINIGDEVWNIYDKAEMIIDSTSIVLSNFRVVNGDQIIDVNGVIAEDPSKSLEYTLSQFELSNLNALLTGNTVLLDGQISANGNLKDLYGHPVYQAEYDINECKLNGKMLGDVWGLIKPHWREVDMEHKFVKGIKTEKIIAFDINGNIVKEGKYQVDYLGKYYLDNRKSPIDFVFNLNDMNMDVANGVVPAGLSEISGRMDGSITMKGRPDSVLFDGFILFKNAAAHVDLLNTDYSFTGKVSIENDGFYMDPGFHIVDKFGSKATVWDASFLHINFTDYAYNFQMAMEEPFLVMNTDKKMSSLYYGDAYVTGDVSVAYDKYNELEIEIAAKSEKGTNVVLPLDGADEVVLPDFISFSDRSNPNETEESGMDLIGIKMNFNMEVTPEAQISLVFDEVVGDVMTGNGTGDISMEIDEFGEFSMYGFYEINEGNYLFTMFDFINKPFTVRKGGTISWYGNPYNADINLIAAYETKASLYDIMPESEREEYRGNTDVNCLMKLTDNLFNPDLSFEIELPKSGESAKAVLNNVISSDEELNKQVFSLMVLNKFLPRSNAISSASGSALGAGVGATSSDLLSSQIGNWLNGLSDDIEIGVNAKLGNQVGEDEVAVLMSKEFLNDRLEISGNFGYSNSNSGTSDEQNNRLIGDVNVQYKLNEEGNVRVRAFNESNDYDPLQTTQNSTQGVGIYYKESFDNWWELRQKLANIFRPDHLDVSHYKGVGRRKDPDYIEGTPF